MAQGNISISYHSLIGTHNIINCIPQNLAPQYSVQRITVGQGTFFELELNMTANPYPQSYTWYKNYNRLDTVVNPEINAGINYFIIQRVELKHEGTYLFNTSNTAGTGSFAFELKVQGMYVCTL